jgi:hypothetical protein
MSNNHTKKQSALSNFNLAFEYDVTWAEAKKSLKDRTL